MQMRHKHHIIPRHMGGSNDPSNIVELTIPEHALAHKKLYEEHGKIEDKIAWLCLSGKKDEAEKLRIELAKNAFKNTFLSDKVKKQKWQTKISKSLKNKKQSLETRQKRSLSLKKAYQENRHSKSDGRHLKKYAKQNKKLLAKLATEGRKKSENWKKSITSEECLLKRCLADPRSTKVFYYGKIYPSIRNAAKNLKINYNKLRTILINKLDSNVYFSD